MNQVTPNKRKRKPTPPATPAMMAVTWLALVGLGLEVKGVVGEEGV